MPEKQVDKHKVIVGLDDQREVILKELVSDSINYCYWTCDFDIRMNGAGSTKMRDLLEESFDAKVALRGRLDLLAQLRNFYRAMMVNRFPLMDKRREHLYALTRPLVMYGSTNMSASQGGAVALILTDWIAQGVDLDRALNFLITEVDGFGDDPFLKRAFLFFLQLNRILGIYDDEVTELPVPADYQVPKMLRHYGILKYSSELAEKVRLGVHLEENSPEEMAIRAATILACQSLGYETGWSASDVDGWFFIRRKQVDGPFHLCKTGNY
jgi:hypothetical protein